MVRPMPNEIVALASVLAGTALGLISSIVVSSIRQRQEVALRLLDQYLEVRKEVVNSVSDLTDLNDYRVLEDETREAHREQVAKLFYKHYDFLPKPVLDALLLLHVALASPEGKLFSVRNNTIVELLPEEIPAFICECCMYK